ncbi:hypothetical protein, variant 3 [Aphanomyces astaci]|nr:hypothetical protein, variant 3 [Aphanomyces astaci]ETV89054.1 hypothetical protein, variant 3 [Aphanomyces astaci]|eukprot:XP_009821454.1 hypothetical protein, variant 3 [Aphanomyces astaci]
MPDLIYGPSVGASLKWLPTNKTFYPGPAFWGSSTAPSDARTNSSTSGILAPPLHAETAMRIFYLAPLDTSMSTPVYTHEAMGFLCDVFPSLYKFHAYLLASRQRTNTSLLSLRHPWESMAAINPGWKSALASVKAAADFAQVISRLQVPTVTAQAFVAQAAVFYPASSHDEIIQDIYYPMLYLASCVGNNSTITSKCATTFDVVDIEFNTIFLRSAEALAEMATLLYQPVTKLGFSCPVPNKVEVQNLAAVVTTLSATLQSELWDPVDLIFKSNSHKYITGMLPLYATKLDESIQMGLISHILPTPNTFHYLCDVFPVSIYPCEESTMASGLATAAGPTPRIGLLIQNYLLYRGLIKNAMHGIARYLMHRTFALTIPTVASKYHFVTVFDTSSGQPPSSAHWTSSSSLSAAIVLNMGLPDVTMPPSPDTPPIDRDAILIVMCIELVVAMAVAVSCVVFSVYFVVKRPREELAMTAPRGSERGGAAAAASPEPTSGPSGLPGSPDKRYLEESLLSDDDDHDEYGSFLSSPVLKPAVGMWSSMKGFVSSISPWG